jgi:DNA-binding NtrC family response regulator
VLLIDDDADLLDAYRLLLTREGWQVLTAQDADAALLLMGDGPLDAIVIDVQMAGRDGLALVEAVATWRPHLLPRVVLNTGYAHEERVQAVVQRLRLSLLEKGCPLPVLLRTLEEVVRRARGR